MGSDNNFSLISLDLQTELYIPVSSLIRVSLTSSAEFDKFRVDTHLCKLRDTSAARFR